MENRGHDGSSSSRADLGTSKEHRSDSRDLASESDKPALTGSSLTVRQLQASSRLILDTAKAPLTGTLGLQMPPKTSTGLGNFGRSALMSEVMPSQASQACCSKAAKTFSQQRTTANQDQHSTKAFEDFLASSPSQPLFSTGWVSSKPTAQIQLASSQEYSPDGAAVVQLLSTAEAVLDNPMPGDDDSLPHTDAVLLSEALFGPEGESTLVMDTKTWLDFTPDFVSDPNKRKLEMMLCMGTTDSAAAWRAWLQRWRHVLSGYTDEVWGYLASPLAEVGHSITRPSCRSADLPCMERIAVQRLRLMLAQIRGHEKAS